MEETVARMQCAVEPVALWKLRGAMGGVRTLRPPRAGRRGLEAGRGDFSVLGTAALGDALAGAGGTYWGQTDIRH